MSELGKIVETVEAYKGLSDGGRAVFRDAINGFSRGALHRDGTALITQAVPKKRLSGAQRYWARMTPDQRKAEARRRLTSRSSS